MDILLFSPDPVDGYPPVQNQATLLNRAGFSVTILTSRCAPDHSPEFAHPDIEVLRHTIAGRSYLGRKMGLLGLILHLLLLRIRKTVRCEIVYNPWGVVMATVCPRRPLFRVAHLHEVLFDPKAHLVEQYCGRFLQGFEKIIVPDEGRAGLLIEQFSSCPDPVVVKNCPTLTDEPEIEAMQASDSSEFSVVYMGTVSRSHGIDTIIRSMVEWPESINFYIYGRTTNDVCQPFQELAQSLGVDARLIFRDWVPTSSVISTLQQHQVGMSILRPRNDNFRHSAGASNKRFQYMKAGLAQISDDTTDVRELIEGNAIGLCVSPDDPKSISSAVCQLFNDGPLRGRFGRNAVELHRRRFNYEQEFEPVLNHLRSRLGVSKS